MIAKMASLRAELQRETSVPRSHGPPWECRLRRSASMAWRVTPERTRSVETRKRQPRGAVESADLPDPPGSRFVCPSHRGHPARDDDLDLAPALYEEESSLAFGHDGTLVSSSSAGGAEAVVVVTVRRSVPVTVRRSDVRRLIVERPAPEETRVWPSPAGRAFYEKAHPAGNRCRHVEQGRFILDCLGNGDWLGLYSARACPPF